MLQKNIKTYRKFVDVSSFLSPPGIHLRLKNDILIYYCCCLLLKNGIITQ